MLEIRTYPDPELRKLSRRIKNIDQQIKLLAKDMIDTMYEAPGAGLAAPQVGVLKRLIVVHIPDENKERNPLVLLNPTIVAASGSESEEEGCLSVPDYTAKVKRPKYIKLSYCNLQGDQAELESDAWLARVLQHEIDHLDGVLFIDRLGKMMRDLAKRKLRKLATL